MDERQGISRKDRLFSRLNTWLGIQVFKSKVIFYGQVAFSTINNIVAMINASTEGIDISADKISISGDTTFSVGYDPTGKIAAGGAAADVNANVTTISGGKITANTVTTSQLNFTPVQSTDVIAKINASAEGIKIEADNISIGGTTTFASGYDPTGKIATGGAAADINNGVTTIDGAKISTGTITASQIDAETITANEIAVGTITVDNMSFTPIAPLGFGLPYLFGSGADGTVTISSNTNYASYTIKQFTNLTVNSGVTLGCSASTEGFLILMCSDTLTVNGTISMDGKGGGQSVGAGTDYSTSYAGSGGGGGGSLSNGAGKAGGDTVVAGGAGGASTPTAGGAGDDIGSDNIAKVRMRTDIKNYLVTSWGAAGGDAGYTDGSYGQGGNGGGGVIIFADTVVIGATGVITCDGVNGGAGSPDNNAGGGGGGGGGLIYIVTRSYTNSGSVAAAAGTGGSPSGPDARAGGSGGAGTVIVEIIPW